MIKSSSIPIQYQESVKSRSTIKYIVGLIIRFVIYYYYSFIRFIARINGATIGPNSILPYSLAKKANKNLIIGEDTIIETSSLDLRDRIIIGDHCIINKQVEIIRLSHCIDNNTTFTTKYYSDLTIEPYSWLCTGCKILPNVKRIAFGSVISAFAILVKDTSEMDIIIGNSQVLRKHNSVFTDLVVCSLKGADLRYYIKAKKC